MATQALIQEKNVKVTDQMFKQKTKTKNNTIQYNQ
jgi:hypothetical protein